LESKKTVIHWDEWLDGKWFEGWENSVIEVWRGTLDLEKSTQIGFQVINAYGWYFNNVADTTGCSTWMDCYERNVFKIVPNAFDPKSYYLLDEKLWKLVIGGEGAAWELSEGCFHDKVWHKLIAISERLWEHPLSHYNKPNNTNSTTTTPNMDGNTNGIMNMNLNMNPKLIQIGNTNSTITIVGPRYEYQLQRFRERNKIMLENRSKCIPLETNINLGDKILLNKGLFPGR